MRVDRSTAQGREAEVFEGRDRDLEALLAAASSLIGGHAGVVLVRGEAGIGKSTLLASSVRAWAADGFNVLCLQADELDRRVPYAALSHGLHTPSWPDWPDARSCTEDLIGALARAGHSSVASIHTAAHRLFSSLRQRAPTVIAIDDLPLVDDDTTVLISNLLRRPEDHPLVLVGTLRHPGVAPSGALATLLQRAEADGALQTVELGPLGDAALEALIGHLVGSRVDPGLVSFICDSSSGNPFLAIQCLIHLQESGAIRQDTEVARLVDAEAPLSIDRRTAVLSRVLHIGPEARQLARALALLGSLSLDRLGLAGELAGLSPDEAERSFDTLVERGIVTSETTTTYRFCHQLLRDALYQELGPAERWRWHKLAAARLRESPQAPQVKHEVARHVRETAEFGDDEAIDVLFTTAERVCNSAPHSSIAWYQHALAITPGEHARRTEMMARLARAFFVAGRTREAADTGRALLASLEPGSPERAHMLMLVLEAMAKLAALDEAADLIDAESPRGWTPQLAATAAHIFAAVARTDDSKAATDEAISNLSALTTTGRIRAMVDLVEAASLTGFATLGPLLAGLDDAAPQAPRSLRLTAYTATSCALALLGDTHACAESIGRAQALLREPHWDRDLYLTELGLAQAHNLFNLGNWEECQSVLDEVTRVGEADRPIAVLDSLLDLQAMLQVHRGDFAAARRTIKSCAPPSQGIFAVLRAAAEAELCLVSGALDRAREVAAAQLEHPATNGLVRSRFIIQLADIALEQGDGAGARTYLGGLREPEMEELDFPTRVRARLARATSTGDPEEVDAASQIAEQHDLRFMDGRARLCLGAMDVDPERNLVRAIRTFQALGATPWRRRAAAALRQRGLPVPRHRPTRSRSGLTETEDQIATLIQLGRSNREIAVTLVLSVKTVEGHLSRMYAKTGCASRLELASALHDGVVPSSGG